MIKSIQATAIAMAEIQNPALGVTEQFLEIHDVVRADGFPVSNSLVVDKNTGEVTVYFPVKDQKFFFAVYLSSLSKPEVIGTDTVGNIRVFLLLSSETLTANQLIKLIKLKPTRFHNKGDQRFGRLLYNYSGVCYEPNPSPDTFQNKLNKLLEYLERDKENIAAITAPACAYIRIAMDLHYGNGYLGGEELLADQIKRIAAMNLSLDFSVDVRGEPW